MIDQLGDVDLSISAICDVLGVSRSGYYSFRQGDRSDRDHEDHRQGQLLREIFLEHRRHYGARRIAREMKDRGESCGIQRVARLMKQQGLQAIQPRSFRPKTTQSRHRLGYSPNLLSEAGAPTGINQVWVGDITYVHLTVSDFYYLSVPMDLCSRKIVGWDLQVEIKEALVLATLQGDIRARQPSPGLIHHTDRGGQYAGHVYYQVLASAQMLQSMSRADNYYANAFMKSFFGTIKIELELVVYIICRKVLKEIKEYIRYYNVTRKNSALDYLSPNQFELP